MCRGLSFSGSYHRSLPPLHSTLNTVSTAPQKYEHGRIHRRKQTGPTSTERLPFKARVMGSSRSLENFIGYLPRFTRVRVARGERGRQTLNERRRKFLRCKGCAIFFSDQLRGRVCEAVGLRVHYGESDAEKTWRGSAGSPHIAHSNGSI